MRIRFHPILLGAFVLGAIALAITALVFLGKIKVFSRPQYFVVYFREPVSGLEKGSAVKLQGVRIGRVKSLSVIWNAQIRQTVVVTVCEVERQVVDDARGNALDITNPHVLPALIDQGLRAKMTLEGVPGLQFVELSLVDPEKYPTKQPPPWLTKEARYPAIPAIESSVVPMVE